MSDDKKVVFPELIKETKEDGCYGCYVWGKYQKRFGSSKMCDANFIEVLTGTHCEVEDIIFKKPENWQTCTRENTKVGDEVKQTTNNNIFKVEHIYNYISPNMDHYMVISDSENSWAVDIIRYKINLNR